MTLVPVHFITMTSNWARWRLKSPAPRLFTQAFIQVQIKESIKAPRHWLCEGNSPVTCEKPRAKNQYRGRCFHLMTSLFPGVEQDNRRHHKAAHLTNDISPVSRRYHSCTKSNIHRFSSELHDSVIVLRRTQTLKLNDWQRRVTVNPLSNIARYPPKTHYHSNPTAQ